MNDSRSDHSARRFVSWFDPEMVVYALLGVFIVGLGARALAKWAAGAWAEGERLLPSSILFLTVSASVAVLVLLRRRKRFMYLALALVAVGCVSYLLASEGFTLPSSWLE